MPNPIDDLLDQAEAATHDELAQGQQQGGSVDDVLNAAEQSTHAELSAQPAQGSGDVMVPGPGRSWYDKLSDYPQAIVNGGTAGAAQIFRGLGLNGPSDDADYADVMQKAAPGNLPADAAPGAEAVTSGAELGAKLYPSVVAGALNPTLGGAVFAAPDAGNRYLDIKEAGGTPVEAVSGAVAQGAVDMVAPKVAEEFTGPLSELLSQYGPAGRTLAQAATGSGTAAGFQAGSAGVSALFPSDAPGTPPGQERWRQELDSIPESMLVGGILGGVPAAAGELSNLRAARDPVTGEVVSDPELVAALQDEARQQFDPARAQEQVLYPDQPTQTLPSEDPNAGPGPVEVTPRQIFERQAQDAEQAAYPEAAPRPEADAEIAQSQAEQAAGLKAQQDAQVEAELRHQIATEDLPPAEPPQQDEPQVAVGREPDQTTPAPERERFDQIQAISQQLRDERIAALKDVVDQRRAGKIGKAQAAAAKRQIEDQYVRQFGERIDALTKKAEENAGAGDLSSALSSNETPSEAKPATEPTNPMGEVAQEMRNLVQEMRADRALRSPEKTNATTTDRSVPETVRPEEGQAGVLRDGEQTAPRPGDVPENAGQEAGQEKEVTLRDQLTKGVADEAQRQKIAALENGMGEVETVTHKNPTSQPLGQEEMTFGDKNVGPNHHLKRLGMSRFVKDFHEKHGAGAIPSLRRAIRRASRGEPITGKSRSEQYLLNHIDSALAEHDQAQQALDQTPLEEPKGENYKNSAIDVPAEDVVPFSPGPPGGGGKRVVGHGGTPSISDHLWGDKSFVKNDVKPTAANAAKGILEAADDIKKAFAPQTRGDQAKTMAGMAREHGATLARRSDIAEQALYTAKRLFDRKKAAENYAFIDRMENGERQPTEDLQHIADAMRSIMDTKRDEIRQLGKGKLEHFIEDYFPHLWKDPEKAINAFSQAAGRRPIEGGKSFLKKRSIPTFKEGIDAGLEPVSENPVDLVLLKAREMDKYLLGQRLMNEMKEKKLAVFVRATEKAPEGFAKINDPIAQVYGPPTIEVKEHVNRARYDALQEVADKLGVKHERKANLGGSMLGYSIQGGNYIASKFASDLSVIAHEISHQLDHKFDLQNLFMKSPDKKTRVAMNKELRALADLHEYKKAYFRKAEEKMASILEAYVAAPDRFKEVAPHVWDEFSSFMDKHEELHPLRDMKQSLAAKRLSTEIPHGGLLKFGEYHAPEEVATLVNNYLSPGLRGKSGLFRAYLGAGNFLNQFQLGFSAFHLGFTSLDAAISKSAIAFKHLDAGRPLEAAKAALQIPVAPLTTMIQGSKVLREWYKPGSQGAEIAAIVDGMRAAGGRARMDTFYQTNVATNMMTAFRKGNVLGGVLRIPGAVMETLSKPIMEFIVPRQKMGVFADMARLEMAKLPEGATRDQVRAAMGKAWDSVDNRMGQLVYDNLFWNKTIKDLSMASVRSVGWNLGTLREVGGGLIDTAKAAGNAARLRRPEFTHRMAYAAALPIITGIVGAITQYLKTGQGPQETKDYFFPKTGEKDENGHDIRLNLPSYMKDIYHYGHDPVAAVTGKLHPLITTVADMLRNKDFFGKEIRNAEDPIVKQALDEATFVGKQFEPMGMRTFTEDRNAGMSTGEKAASFVGVTKAPKYLSQSKAEQLAGEVGQEKYHGEPMSPELLQSRREVLTKLRSQDPQTQKEGQKQLDGLVDKRQMTMRQAKNLVRQSHLSRLEYQVTGMSVDDAMRVWRVAEPAERTEIRDEIAGKIMRSSSIDPGEKKSLMDEIQGELKSTGKKSSQSVSR